MCFMKHLIKVPLQNQHLFKAQFLTQTIDFIITLVNSTEAGHLGCLTVIDQHRVKCNEKIVTTLNPLIRLSCYVHDNGFTSQ